jgi:hypothetical protein
MGDMGELYNALRAEDQERRAANAALAPALIAELEGLGHRVVTLSENGPHLRVDGRIDFWPSTGRWIVTGKGRGGRGKTTLLAALSPPEGQSIVKTDRSYRSRRSARH